MTIDIEHSRQGGTIVVSYTNEAGALVAERLFVDEPWTCEWTVRLYFDPEEYDEVTGLSETAAHQLCIEHASQF
jgi:hypothetical protein